MTKDETRGAKPPAQNERDDIQTLALSSMPLSSNTLKAARLVKNSKMETAIELYHGPLSGSFHVSPEDISEQLTLTKQDLLIITQLATLQSYDVFSLKTSLKKLGIEVNDPKLFELSDGLKEKLSGIGAEFIYPLLERIFGSGSPDEHNVKDLYQLFRDPDVNRVRKNLKALSEKTGFEIHEIPRFLESYSNLYLSVAYYRYSFEQVFPEIERFLLWIKALQNFREVSSSPGTLIQCKKAEELIRHMAVTTNGRLAYFKVCFEPFWQDINKDSFQHLTTQIEDKYASTGATLCGLMVKIRSWAKEYPDNLVGGPIKRATYVVTELMPGLEKMKAQEAEQKKTPPKTA